MTESSPEQSSIRQASAALPRTAASSPALSFGRSAPLAEASVNAASAGLILLKVAMMTFGKRSSNMGIESMSKSSGKTKPPKGKVANSEGSGEAPDPSSEHIEAGAEDFEHTLRRLITEKEKKRAKNFGMYL